MAAACSNSCDICMNNFNGADRKSVALPCGHDFCLTCLVRLKTSASHKCPKCRVDWAELEVESLPGMEDEEGPGQQGEEDDADDNGKKGGDLCGKHQFSFQYWCVEENEFHCKKCIVEKRCLQLELIDDAIPLIKTDLSRRVTERLVQNQTDLGELEQLKNEFSGKLDITKRYKEEVQKHEDDLHDCVTKIELHIVEKRKSLILAEKIQGRIEKVNSQLDVPLVVKSRTTLEALSKPTDAPNTDTSRALICNIACAYMEVTGLGGPSSETAFTRRLLEAFGSSVGPLSEVNRAAEELKGRGEWTVDSLNCLATLLALTDRQPSVFTLTARRDESETLPAAGPVAAVAKAARGCEVRVHFLDSCCLPQDPKIDFERLDHIAKNSSMRITQFMGHLDTAGIAKLPRTISLLGLAIGNAADARAVSGLQPWDELLHLGVFISCGVAAQDLRPLPRDRAICLHFLGLTDALVDSVRPAIEALAGGRRLDWLKFIRSQLTAGGVRRLARLLHGAEIGNLTFSANHLWQPDGDERRRVEAELEGVVGCRVEFE